MNKLRLLGAACAITLASTPVLASPVSIDISYTILNNDIANGDISGSYLSEFSVGDVIQASFVYDDDETLMVPDIAKIGAETEHAYEYTGTPGPYGASVINSSAAYSFDATFYGADVVDNLAITQTISDEINGKIALGTYDIFDVWGDTEDINNNIDEDWEVVIIADDANWFSDASVFPDSLPSSYTALLLGSDFDAMGNEIGRVVLAVDITVSSAPVPAAVWLFGSGLLGLVGVARRKKA